MGMISGHLVKGIPGVKEGDDLASIIEERFSLQDKDVICIASTVVSKSESMARNLDHYTPATWSLSAAERLGKDPRFVQAVMEEAEEILIDSPFLLTVTKFGHIGVNAGIDKSNVGDGHILLLPRDPQASAENIRSRLSKDCAVIITDTCGRPFRCGVAGVAIGWAGIGALRDWRGQRDMEGRELEITQEAIVDEIAAMANFLMGEGGDGTPVVVFRGLNYPRSGGQLFRPEEADVIRAHLKKSD
jgi:coenzyme F420-0:L-glutamate ligase/coenzyme F420-1:gamma-L-glutamate ligase